MADITKVLLVVNPISGAINKVDLVKEIKKEIFKRNATLYIFKTKGEEDVFNLNKKIEEILPDRIIVAGGDGTIKLAAEALKDKDIPIGIIPAGSANGLSVNLDLPENLQEQIEVALNENIHGMDVILINDKYCLHMSDFGVNAELIKRYESSKIRGKLGYLLNSIPTLVESEYPFEFQIETNGQVLQKEGILLAIANAKSYGTGATVNPNGKINDGFFEILVFKNFDILEMLKTLRTEVEFDRDFVEIISTKSAKITCKKPVSFQIDGEYLGKRQVIEARILPQKIQIATPEEEPSNFHH